MPIGSVWGHSSGLDYYMNYYMNRPRGESDVLSGVNALPKENLVSSILTSAQVRDPARPTHHRHRVARRSRRGESVRHTRGPHPG